MTIIQQQQHQTKKSQHRQKTVQNLKKVPLRPIFFWFSHFFLTTQFFFQNEVKKWIWVLLRPIFRHLPPILRRTFHFFSSGQTHGTPSRPRNRQNTADDERLLLLLPTVRPVSILSWRLETVRAQVFVSLSWAWALFLEVFVQAYIRAQIIDIIEPIFNLLS